MRGYAPVVRDAGDDGRADMLRIEVRCGRRPRSRSGQTKVKPAGQGHGLDLGQPLLQSARELNPTSWVPPYSITRPHELGIKADNELMDAAHLLIDLDRARAVRPARPSSSGRPSTIWIGRWVPCCRQKCRRPAAATGLPDDAVTIKLEGQWPILGLRLAKASRSTSGDANDGCGKGLSGGRVIVSRTRRSSREVTSGRTRTSSSATSLVMAPLRQGVFPRRRWRTVLRAELRRDGGRRGHGDHGCEYMTGGRVVCLGKTGIVTRGRHERRHRVRPRSRFSVCGQVQHGHGRARSCGR